MKNYFLVVLAILFLQCGDGPDFSSMPSPNSGGPQIPNTPSIVQQDPKKVINNKMEVEATKVGYINNTSIWNTLNQKPIQGMIINVNAESNEIIISSFRHGIHFITIESIESWETSINDNSDIVHNIKTAEAEYKFIKLNNVVRVDKATSNSYHYRLVKPKDYVTVGNEDIKSLTRRINTLTSFQHTEEILRMLNPNMTLQSGRKVIYIKN